jgi:alpha-galactosidase
MDGMPHLDVNTAEAETLEIVLKDIVSGAKVHLFYVVFSDIDIIARHTVIENNTDKEVTIDSINSAVIDFTDSDFDMLSLYGRWANERTVERHPLFRGKSVISSSRGASGNHSNPFAALARKDTTEDSGEVYAMALVYSGNFEIGADASQFGNTRFYAGMGGDFSWQLKSGESFVSPQAILTYSCEGFTKMSHNFHSACRNHLGACAIQKKHPILLNLWEAFYFEVDEQKAVTAINAAKNFGIDTVVLDDGWFGKRNSDKDSMGDWFVNKEKFPNGLQGIINCCKENNLKFGLWFEPEMVAPDSDLFRAHPDWCIHIDGVEPIKSRYEYILDLSRDEVCEYVYNTIADILKNNDISYIKWDMNRNMTDNGSAWLGEGRQGEHAHRYILGVYKLMEKFRKNFPNIFFEGCAGGGGRYDFGILYYMPQIWASDNSDAIARLKIQHGTSFVYPPETISAHVSECPNHQTGRITPFETRGNVAQLFSFGYEFNPTKMSEAEVKQINEQIKKHRQLEEWLPNAEFYRLIDPKGAEDCAWQAVSEDKKKSVAVYTLQLTQAEKPGKFLRLKGLEGDEKYLVEPYGIIAYGDLLMNAGVPIKKRLMDFESVLLEINQI